MPLLWPTYENMPPALVSHYLSPYWVSTMWHILYGEKFSWDKIFANWPLAKTLRKYFCGSMITKPRPYWVYANHTHITRESAVMVNEFSVEAMVRGYHTYEDIWAMSKSVRYYRHWATAWRSPFPFVNRLFSMLFTPALAKTMEDIGTFVDREPVGSGSFGSLSTLLK